MKNKLVISFADLAIVPVIWSAQRKALFGLLPRIEVWAIDADGNETQQHVPIQPDLPYPNTTLFTINMSGPATGYIILQ